MDNDGEGGKDARNHAQSNRSVVPVFSQGNGVRLQQTATASRKPGSLQSTGQEANLEKNSDAALKETLARSGAALGRPTDLQSSGPIPKKNVVNNVKEEKLSKEVSEVQREWRDPTPDEQAGGKWLVGKYVRVLWQDDGDDSWNVAEVVDYESEIGEDSHGEHGPLHHMRYFDGDFTEVLNANTRWQIAVSNDNSKFGTARGSSGGSASRVGCVGGSATRTTAQWGSKRPKVRVADSPASCENGERRHGEQDMPGSRNRERKLSARMREAVLDLTDDSDDDFRCEIERLRHAHLGLNGQNKKRKMRRSKEGRVVSRIGPASKGSRLVPKFGGSEVPRDFLEDSSDPLFVGCNVEIKMGPLGDWIRARFVGKVEGSAGSVRVITLEGEEVAEAFVFYPCKKEEELGCISGYDGSIRIPMGADEWKGMTPGRHVRVAFDDGVNYLGVIAYATASRDWHVFFEDSEEIDIKIPAEDAIPVPKDCSEWVTALGNQWWGHRYAMRLRDGADPAIRKLKEMRQIVEDRLDRSSSMAFRARLPSKEQLIAERRRKIHRNGQGGPRINHSGANLLKSDGVEKAGGKERRGTLVISDHGSAVGIGNVLKDLEVLKDFDPEMDLIRNRVTSYLDNMDPSVKIKLDRLRKREDKSTIQFKELSNAIQARGGLSEVEGIQDWENIMEQLNVDPSNIEKDSAATFRAWYVAKKKASRKKRQLKYVAKKNAAQQEKFEGELSRPRGEKAAQKDKFEGELTRPRGDSVRGDSEQPLKLRKLEASSDSRQMLESGAEDSNCEVGGSDEDAPLRPRKLTERLYHQHVKNLKDLFSSSLLSRTAGEPKWRACALGGKPCPVACNCKWTTFSVGVAVPASISAVSKAPNATNGAAALKSADVPEIRSVPESSAGSNSQSGKIQDETNAPLGLAAEKNECGPCKLAAVQRSESEMSAMETPSFEHTVDGQAPQEEPTSRTHKQAPQAPQEEPTSRTHKEGTSTSRITNKQQWSMHNQKAMPEVGFVCLSDVAGRSRSKNLQVALEHHMREEEENESVVHKKLISSATSLVRWWRRVKFARNSASVFAATSSGAAEMLESEEVQESGAFQAEQGGGADQEIDTNVFADMFGTDGVDADELIASRGASCVNAVKRPASAAGVEKKHQDMTTLEQCPKCSRDFTKFPPKQRGANVARHMQNCCAGFIRPSPRPMKGQGWQKVSCTRLVLEQELETQNDSTCVAPEQTSAKRFSDPFAAFRCCGRTFLRTQDMEKHWSRRHTCGVLACANGYADPANLLREKNNRLGQGIKLITAPVHTHTPVDYSFLPPIEKDVQCALPEPFSVRGVADTDAGAANNRPLQQLQQGKGKGGNFWLAGHRSLSFAAAALSHNSYDSDDSIDIVIR